MKTIVIDSIKQILADRIVVALILLLILSSLAYCIYVGLSLHPSDLQVAVHYTAYGQTSFYREKWYYLISFILFGLVLATAHSALVVKLYVQERRQMAILFAWLSILLIAIAWFLTRAVLGIAFPT
ncbi:MAG TPA: hypothetical protein VK497_03100 [Candidatus Saccharimonadales bacterium]|nr:hypothetical protein [Candidatus Saccharimonadales bacterium]